MRGCSLFTAEGKRPTLYAQRPTSNERIYGYVRLEIGDLSRRSPANAGSVFSLLLWGIRDKVTRPHSSEKFLKLFRSDLERTGKNTTLSKKPINL
jgi:hypothetical protein